MILSEGIEFFNADPKVVTNYLETLERSKLEVNPSGLKIKSTGSSLILQVMNGSVKEYPVRKSFLYKLLNWYKFPVNQIYRLSLETIASICNDYLMNIKRNFVVVKLENNEALSLLSPDYTELTDLEVIRVSAELGVRTISRNDFMMRLESEEKVKVEPVPGDACGVGFSIVNSETGFRALRAGHFILRYICSNGATVRAGNEHSKFHYEYKEEELRTFLYEQLNIVAKERSEVIARLIKLVRQNSSKHLKRLLPKVEALLGKKDSEKFFESITQDSNSYELFNLITNKAQSFDLSKKLYLESLAGEIIIN